MKTRLLIGFLLLCLFFQFSSFKSVNSQTDYQNSESMPVIQMAVFVDAIVVGAVGLLSELNLDLATLSTDPAAISTVDWHGIINFSNIWDYLVIILASLVILFVFVVVAAIFYRKSLNSLAQKTGVGLFGTTGLILLIGAVLTIIVIGFLLLWVALILLTVAFFSIKPESAQPPPAT